MQIKYNKFMNPLIQVLLTFLTSFIICFFAIPSIIKVSKLKHLYDEPCHRKRHSSNIPTLGGIGIFAGFIFSVTFWSNQHQLLELQYIIASLIILFFMGIKDDIVNLVAHKKLMGQIFAASIIVFYTDIRLTSLYGIFDIYEIPYFISTMLSVFTIISLTNAFNLIDGIDTLAASIGSFSCIVFGLWFFLSTYYQYSIVCASMLGALIAFLKYNKTPARIFMGDTGSLIIGLIISVMAIKFIELNRVYEGPIQFKISSVPAIAISILIIPIFDILRVFNIRILQGKSPLEPDRNHLHHILTDIGYSHIKSTTILLAFNITLTILTFWFQRYPGEVLLTANILSAIAFSFYFSRKRRKIFHFKQLPSLSNPYQEFSTKPKNRLIDFDSNLQ